MVACAAAPPTLTSPANGAIDQPLRPVFQWTAAAGADSYALEVDDDSAFGSPAIDETGIPGTTYTPTIELDDATIYYWRVRSENLCGPGAASTTFSFTTLSLLPFEDGFESGRHQRLVDHGALRRIAGLGSGDSPQPPARSQSTERTDRPGPTRGGFLVA